MELIDIRFTEMAAECGATYPSEMKCLTTDAAGLTACLRFPADHQQRIRHPNFIDLSISLANEDNSVIFADCTVGQVGGCT